jgi:hypothetical protein
VFKNAEFLAHFKYVKKVVKVATKIVLNKNIMKYALFSLLLMFKLVLLIPFLVHFFKNFSTDLKSA